MPRKGCTYSRGRDGRCRSRAAHERTLYEPFVSRKHCRNRSKQTCRTSRRSRCEWEARGNVCRSRVPSIRSYEPFRGARRKNKR
jgi:hypothetical protein